MKRTNTAICYQSTLPGWQKQRYLDMAYLKHWRKVQSTACSIALQSREESDIDSDDDCVIHDIETYSDVDILVTGFSLDSEKPSVKEKLVEWATKNQLTRSSLNELSEILRDEDIPLPKDARTLLQTPRAVAIENKCGGKYAYFESKPSSIEGYLHDFIEEFTNIEKDEILMNNVTLKTFVCDAPARSFLKCTKGHTGYYACEVKGSYTSSRVVLHETGDFLPRTEKSSNVRIQQPSHDPGPSPVPGSHDPGPSPVPGSHDPGPSPVPGIHDPGPRLGRNPGPAPRLGRNPGSCRLQRLGPRLGTNSGPGLSLGPGLQDLRKAAPGRCPGINPGPGLSLGPGLQDPRKAALGRGPGINPGPDPDLSLGPGLQDLRMAAPERGSRINPGPGLQDPRELIGIEYLYRQTGHTLEDMMEEQDEEEGFVLEDENENLDEGFEEIDLTLPTPVMATRPDVLTFGSETYTSDSETSTPEKPKRRGFLKPEARLLLAINENEEFISHSLSSLNSSPPVMPVYVTPSVSEIESDNVEGCFVGQNRGPAQYPDQNRYVEAVMVKLCARHLRNIPQNKVLFQRWSLVMNDYKSIREKVNSNDRVMKSTSLQIFNVNVRTISAWSSKREKMQEKAIIGQALILPKPLRTASNPLPAAISVQKSPPRVEQEQQHHFELPENTAAKKLRREKKLAEDLAKAASKRSSTMCASNGVVSSPIQKPWSPDTLKRRLEHNLSTVLGYGTHPQSDDCRVIEIPWDILLIAWQGTKYSTPHVPVCKQTAGYYVEAVGVGMADTVAAALKKHKDLHLPKNADLESDDELDDCEKSKEFHGAFYELHAISVRLLREEKNFPQLDTVSNGLVLELRSFYDKSAKSKTLNSIYNVLCEINSAFCMSNSQAVLTKLSHVLEQKKKLVSKKKVAGVKNIKDFLLKEFEQLETTTKSKTNTTELLAPLQNSASITLDDTINQIKNSFRLDDDSNRNLSSSLSTQTHRIKSSVGSRC
ncbi:hypothetical protein GQR58_016655 [Nymphon striatum]|nr:hypothetical protein GQR58_016655 [Nymphon striatum]